MLYFFVLDHCVKSERMRVPVVGFWVLKISGTFDMECCKGLFNLFKPLKLKPFWQFRNGLTHWCCLCCSFKEAVVFDQNILLRFGSTRSQFAGRTLYQSRIWSSTHERAAPAFERTLSSRSLTSRSLNSSTFTNNTIRQKCIVDINKLEPEITSAHLTYLLCFLYWAAQSRRKDITASLPSWVRYWIKTWGPAGDFPWWESAHCVPFSYFVHCYSGKGPASNLIHMLHSIPKSSLLEDQPNLEWLQEKKTG